MSAIAPAQRTSTLPFPTARPAATEFLAGGRVKGTIVAAHVQWVKQNRTADEYIRFWEAIPRETRNAIGMVLPVKWYEFAHLIAIDHAIVDLFGHGSNSILREIGAQSARMNLSGAYKAFTRDSIHEFFANAARLHSQFQDFGVAMYSSKSNSTAGIMMITGYVSHSPLYCASAIGFYEEAIKIHGGQNVIVTEAQCQCRGDRACSFVMRWR